MIDPFSSLVSEPLKKVILSKFPKTTFELLLDPDEFPFPVVIWFDGPSIYSVRRACSNISPDIAYWRFFSQDGMEKVIPLLQEHGAAKVTIEPTDYFPSLNGTDKPDKLLSVHIHKDTAGKLLEDMLKRIDFLKNNVSPEQIATARKRRRRSSVSS